MFACQGDYENVTNLPLLVQPYLVVCRRIPIGVHIPSNCKCSQLRGGWMCFKRYINIVLLITFFCWCFT